MAEIYRTVAELPPARVWDGAVARALHSERLTIGFVDIDANVQVPEHRHENEQVGFVVRGTVTMVIDGQSRELPVGSTYTIGSNVPHSAKGGPQGCTVVDVFAPGRADWKQLTTQTPSPGGWPQAKVS